MNLTPLVKIKNRSTPKKSDKKLSVYILVFLQPGALKKKKLLELMHTPDKNILKILFPVKKGLLELMNTDQLKGKNMLKLLTWKKK